MKTILISGGGGYLGTYLTQVLLKKNYVVVYDEFFFKWLYKNRKKVKFNTRLKIIKKDILNVTPKDFKNVDIVCDLNGIPNDPSSELNKKYTWEINYYGRKKFAEIAKKSGVSRYIFNSTCAVYGYNKNTVNENSKTNPLSTYAKANLKAEKAIFKLKSKNFQVNILRNSTLFGFSQNLRLDLVINIFVNSLINTSNITVDGDGRQWRPFISLNDVCKIYEKIISKNSLPSFIVNLVAFNSTIKMLAFKIVKYFGKTEKNIKFISKNKDPRNYKTSSKNLKKYIGNINFTNFNYEINNLVKGIKKYKIKLNRSTIRMKFYRSRFLKR